ncbi:phenol hydroxylase [Stutzerimonas stutzeri]|uniref:Phenol hydroxylase n=1 Tax=Stutzerimonas stutzeri TaxID=316 RepID=A0A2N8T9V3_STUST|nr:phenol hydroxylase subunit P4 [Stutzerimonas stutzeri]MCQ4326696.1 phenol hydroxylase subunit P4 [Stutzerimonas stutzeri]PNG11531.1 phenol hydroxylase [Stutzerimonas stutzeri]
MTVKAIGEYRFRPLDVQEHFHGNQLLYVGWDRHLMFCSPLALLVAPTLSFAELLDQVIAPAFAAHPDSAAADLRRATWYLNDEPFQPELSASLAANGLRHKDMLRLDTPGLNGIAGSCS